jgi:hypothetical protein
LAVKAVEPQLVVEGFPKELYDHDGSLKVRISLIDSGTFRAKAKEITEGACVTSFRTEIMLKVTAGVGMFTAVEVAMAMALRSAALAKVALTVREFRFATCS